MWLSIIKSCGRGGAGGTYLLKYFCDEMGYTGILAEVGEES